MPEGEGVEVLGVIVRDLGYADDVAAVNSAKQRLTQGLCSSLRSLQGVVLTGLSVTCLILRFKIFYKRLYKIVYRA